MFIKKIILPALAFTLLFSCNNKVKKNNNQGAMKAEMIAAENAFSALSQQKGTRQALMQFIDSNGVLLRANTFPLVGANAIDFISQANDSSYTMIWQPKGASVAASGELGYTYGVYSITPKNDGPVMYGTYVNIWKKQPGGTWKLLLDSGNEGVEN